MINEKHLLRAVTYNIHRCIGGDGVKVPDRIINVLKSLEADVIALQEVEAATTLDGGMLGYIVEQTGLYPTPGLTMFDGDSHYGNALLSKTAPASVRRYDLSADGREPRGLLAADFDCGPQQFKVFVTHLGLQRGERRFQIGRLLHHLKPVRRIPSIIMGDFNE